MHRHCTAICMQLGRREAKCTGDDPLAALACFSPERASTPPPFAVAPSARPLATGSVHRNRSRMSGPAVTTTSPVVKTVRMTIAGSATSRRPISRASGVVTARGRRARRRAGDKWSRRAARMEVARPKEVLTNREPKTCGGSGGRAGAWIITLTGGKVERGRGRAFHLHKRQHPHRSACASQPNEAAASTHPQLMSPKRSRPTIPLPPQTRQAGPSLKPLTCLALVTIRSR